MGIVASSAWKTIAREERIDWHAIRDRIDLARVVTALLGPAPGPGRRGEGGRRLWWKCPLHEDRNPSFCVETGRRWWKCFGCGEEGDAPNLVMRLRGMAFPEAVRIVAELSGACQQAHQQVPSVFNAEKTRPSASPAAGAPEKAPQSPLERSSGSPSEESSFLVREAQERLWKPEGKDTLGYLRGRGLTDATIRAARLGVVAFVSIPTRDGERYYCARGVVIPWFDRDRLALVKIRQPEGTKPKYAEAYRDRPTLYPGKEVIHPGKPLVITEGEFDALLLGQALGELAAVVTLGSASNRPDPTILGELLAAAPWFVATDNDPAGDKAAGEWPARAIRVRPPGSFKDWTEASCAGVNLRRWWSDRLAGIEAPPLFSWEELAAWRWGPARDDPTPGIVVDRPDPDRLKAALKGADLNDPYALAERLAIQREHER